MNARLRLPADVLDGCSEQREVESAVERGTGGSDQMCGHEATELRGMSATRGPVSCPSRGREALH